MTPHRPRSSSRGLGPHDALSSRPGAFTAPSRKEKPSDRACQLLMMCLNRHEGAGVRLGGGPGGHREASSFQRSRGGSLSWLAPSQPTALHHEA